MMQRAPIYVGGQPMAPMSSAAAAAAAAVQQRMSGAPMLQRFGTMPPGAMSAAAAAAAAAAANARLRVPQYYSAIYQPSLHIGGGQLPPPEPPSADTFLAGCCFVLDELAAPIATTSGVGGAQLASLAERHDVETRIRFYGGDVETSALPSGGGGGEPQISPVRVTHIVADALTAKVRVHVVRMSPHGGGARLVTSAWLADALARRRLEPPTRACHLPTPWSDGPLPGANKVSERKRAHEM